LEKLLFQVTGFIGFGLRKEHTGIACPLQGTPGPPLQVGSCCLFMWWTSTFQGSWKISGLFNIDCPDMEGSCKYIEKAVMENWQGGNNSW